MIIAVIVLITLVAFAAALMLATAGPRERADVATATKLYAVRCQIASALLRTQVRAEAARLRRELNRQFEELDNRRPHA